MDDVRGPKDPALEDGITDEESGFVRGDASQLAEDVEERYARLQRVVETVDPFEVGQVVAAKVEELMDAVAVRDLTREQLLNVVGSLCWLTAVQGKVIHHHHRPKRVVTPDEVH